MRTGALVFVALLALTACGGSSAPAPIAVPANFNSIESAMSSAVTQESTDLSAESNDAASGPGDSAGACYNLTANVDYDVKTNIGRDVQNVTYDAGNLQSAISTMRSDINNLHTDVLAVANEGTPIPADINAFITSAAAQMQQAMAKANGEIDQANRTTLSAYDAANAMATGPCSGDGPGSAPAPIAHIT